MMGSIILIYFAFLSVAIIDSLAILITASLMRVKIEAVGVFRFPKRVGLKFFGVNIRVGRIPFPSSYVKFSESLHSSQEWSKKTKSGYQIFKNLSVSRKLVIVLSGVFCNLALASIFLGSGAAKSIFVGFAQLGQSLTHHELGLYYFEQISVIENTKGRLIAWSVLTTKVVMINLLPIPGFYGGYIISTFYEAVTGKEISSKKMGSIALLILMAVSVHFIFNWGGFIFQLFFAKG